MGATCASANQATAENPKIEAVHSVNERTQHQNGEDVVGAACASANQPTAAKQNNQAVYSKETLTSAKKDPPSLTPK